MSDFHDVKKEKIKEHNPSWPQIPDHPQKILKTGGSGSGKTNSLFNLTNQQADIDKVYLYAKDPYEPKYQFSTNKWDSTDSKHLNDSTAFIECSNGVIFTKILKNIIQIKNLKC